MNKVHGGKVSPQPFGPFSFKQSDALFAIADWADGAWCGLRALVAVVLAASGFAVPVATTSPSRPSASGVKASRLKVPGPKASPAAGPVLEVGDSLGIDLGWGLSDELPGSRHRLVVAAVGDTGLAEPSYYDWPAQLIVDLRLYHPATVVVFLGANDVESFYSNNRFLPFGSPGWAAYYGGRVAKMMDEAVGAGAKVLWVGMPPMEGRVFPPTWRPSTPSIGPRRWLIDLT